MISVVLATYNEADNLPKCLEAVADLADEIVVVDGASSDKTIEIAKNFGARIISTTNKKNFHINKQMAIDAAKGSLILQLDADEVVDSELHSWIATLHEQLGKKNKQLQQEAPVAWYIKRKNHFLGRFLTKGGQYPDPVIRLFIAGKAKLPQKDVHEQMVVDGVIGTAEGHLLHYGNPTFADYLRKFNTYTSFSAKQQLDQGTRLTIRNTLRFFFFKPVATFFLLFVRHKGFVDGMAGFVFALMSALHFPVMYLKLWELYQETQL